MRQRKYLACLTLILKIYKQNSKFVIQNNDNQKNVNEQVSNRKKTTEKITITTEMDELEEKLCKISVMRLFCLKSKNKNATDFGWIANACSFILSRFKLFCFRLHFWGVCQCVFVLNLLFFRFCSHLFEIFWNITKTTAAAWNMALWHQTEEREREKEKLFSLFCCFKCNSHRHPLQLLESDGNYYGSMFEYTGTNADRTVAHCAFALHIQYQFYWFFSHFLYTSATTMPKWMK